MKKKVIKKSTSYLKLT